MVAEIGKSVIDLGALADTVVILSCRDRSFFDRIGRYISPDSFDDFVLKHLIEACQSIFKEMGHGPSAPEIALQRIHRWHYEGKISLAEMREVNAFIATFDGKALPPTEEIINEVAPLLRASKRLELVDQLADAIGKGKRLSEFADKIQSAESIGIGAKISGTVVEATDFDDLADMGDSMLATGVPELDMGLGGGLPRGSEGVVIGGPSDGKSMFLVHVASQGLLQGLNVAYISLELSVAKTKRRIVSNITSIPMNDLKTGGKSITEAAKRWEALKPRMGTLVIGMLDSGISTAPDAVNWVRAQEERQGISFDLVVIDYADKLESHKNNKTSDYQAMEHVYEHLRLYAEQNDKFLWTASQARRKQDTKKILDMNDVADSMNKVRVADIIVTINLDKESGELTFAIPKNRDGEPSLPVGPIVHNYSCAQLAIPVSQTDTSKLSLLI